MKNKFYLEPETHLSEKQVNEVDLEDASILATFDRITEKIKHGRTEETVTGSAGFGVTEAMSNDYVADFLDLAIPEKVFDKSPHLNNVVHDWLIGKKLPEADLNILKKFYLDAVKSGKLRLPPEYMN